MRKTWLIFSQAVTVAVAVLFTVSTLKPEWLQRGGRRPDVVSIVTADEKALRASSAGSSFSAASKRAAPAVVSITASKTPPRHPALNPNDPWFQFFFGEGGQQQNDQPQVGLGSGVVVSAEGYLLTNNHVIAGADDIEVQLNDGRKAQAKLVGTDPDTDVAVLKIELDKLPVITFGNTDHVEVGDVVLAIGNPFGVGQTVTSGIVSALGRNQLGINTFENFIQTDAAINPGNSGGALVDVQGHLLGINTAIYSRSGGSMGIGFAIPVNSAKQVMESLIQNGEVQRGWIGVEPRDLTAAMAQTFDLPVKEGVLITGVLQSGPAAQGGLRPGDVVVQINEVPIRNTIQLLNAVAELKPRSEVPIRVQRGSRTVDLTVRVAQRPKPTVVRQ
ncbi:MAG: Do family serine endopeptidase [Pseudomonadota bacterium]